MHSRGALSGSPCTVPNESGALRQPHFSGSISPQGLKTEPVVARQFEQWQLYASTKASKTSKATYRQPQRPWSTRSLMPGA